VQGGLFELSAFQLSRFPLFPFSFRPEFPWYPCRAVAEAQHKKFPFLH
jgi:hypothetical protein